MLSLSICATGGLAATAPGNPTGPVATTAELVAAGRVQRLMHPFRDPLVILLVATAAATAFFAVYVTM